MPPPPSSEEAMSPNSDDKDVFCDDGRLEAYSAETVTERPIADTMRLEKALVVAGGRTSTVAMTATSPIRRIMMLIYL